jgi:hypothetical protein
MGLMRHNHYWRVEPCATTCETRKMDGFGAVYPFLPLCTCAEQWRSHIGSREGNCPLNLFFFQNTFLYYNINNILTGLVLFAGY